ncbi:15KDa protein [Beet soil-borne mosaic virus]|uniref:15 kDa protein n=1 Tax=Beet soil-borne mosaic virus TaxID=76343 RepID=O72594_9VIRU|nr:15 kDa protein [Beet soil-borne mosaic virus]AAC18573.1 15KDa protein [Beet soil-borne mosaic virus]AEK48988.1 15 kDa protein [Beet soil-borne mosaic virus]APZ76018.1 15K protein [Beet soil-borne mosaic virus]WIW79801.1 triple gene block 3 protein [Beet soil-borne mosaic virus]
MVLVVKVDFSTIVLYIVAGVVVVSVLYSPFFSNEVKAGGYAGAIFPNGGCIMDRNSFAQFGGCDIPKYVADSISRVAIKELDADIKADLNSVVAKRVVLYEGLAQLCYRVFSWLVCLFMVCLMLFVWFWYHS